MTQSHTDYGNCHSGRSRYCHTALDLFTAAAAGWAPVSSKVDLDILLAGSETERKLANHLSVASSVIRATDQDDDRDKLTSFDILRDHFDMPSHLPSTHCVQLWHKVTSKLTTPRETRLRGERAQTICR